jgi:hypothetical protein
MADCAEGSVDPVQEVGQSDFFPRETALRAKRSLPALLLESLDCLAGRNDWNTGGPYKLQKAASITRHHEICAARNGGCNHMVIIGVFNNK